MLNWTHNGTRVDGIFQGHLMARSISSVNKSIQGMKIGDPSHLVCESVELMYDLFNEVLLAEI